MKLSTAVWLFMTRDAAKKRMYSRFPPLRGLTCSQKKNYWIKELHTEHAVGAVVVRIAFTSDTMLIQ